MRQSAVDLRKLGDSPGGGRSHGPAALNVPHENVRDRLLRDALAVLEHRVAVASAPRERADRQREVRLGIGGDGRATVQLNGPNPSTGVGRELIAQTEPGDVPGPVQLSE